MNVYTVELPPYGELSISGGETIAYINGNAPKLYVRIGSDAVCLPEGQSIPVNHTWAKLQNPYPRGVSLTIGRGQPVRFGARATSIGDHHIKTVKSEAYRVQAAGAAGTRLGLGVLMKRGSALVRINDKLLDANSNVVIFRGASPAFIAAKPPTAFPLAVGFRGQNLDPDTSMYAVFGEYTPADVLAWIAAANYTGEVIETRHSNERTYIVSAEDAVFFCRYNATGYDAVITLEHQGADIGEFD